MTCPRFRPKKAHIGILALALGALAAFTAASEPLAAQGPGVAKAAVEDARGPSPSPLNTFQYPLPETPERAPRPLVGPKSIKEAVEVSSHDATFKILVGQGRILSTKFNLIAAGKTSALVAVGDPSIVEFVIVNSRQIRVVGQRLGTTDLTVTSPDGESYSFEIQVVADFHVLQGRLNALFPDASIQLSQIREHLVVEGQARDAAQVNRILETIKAYLTSVQVAQTRRVSTQQRNTAPIRGKEELPPAKEQPGDPTAPPTGVTPEAADRQIQAAISDLQVINLLRVPGSKQVLLKVRVAELNRTAFRQIGADILGLGSRGRISGGTQLGANTLNSTTTLGNRTITGITEALLNGGTSAFGVFEQGDFAIFLSALRRNNLLRILAEPNLVALNGHAATFLAGGEFPIPVPQGAGAVGGAGAITVQFREFGVRLGFLPTIQDGDIIRLAVDPEVSSIDPTLGTVLVPGGTPVPGLSTRKAHTVVEMREGQTLAMAGLLQLTLDGTTSRIPLLGDMPILGPFFSNTTGNRIEKELIVLVTPYLVEPQAAGQSLPTPGDDVETPSDWDFYLHRKIERRVTVHGTPPATMETAATPPTLIKLDAHNVRGPHGFAD